MVQLGGVEAEHANVAELGNRAAVDLDAEGMRRIIDQPQAMPPGDIGQGVQVAGVSVNVHGQDGGRPRRDGRFDSFGVQRVGVRFDVDENGLQAVGDQRVAGGDERERRGDDFAGQLHACKAICKANMPLANSETFGVSRYFSSFCW